MEKKCIIFAKIDVKMFRLSRVNVIVYCCTSVTVLFLCIFLLAFILDSLFISAVDWTNVRAKTLDGDKRTRRR